MANAHDIAAYIIGKHGAMSSMKLHKILYYCQAWSLVWDDKPMFPERIEAWANGPVVPDLFQVHRGKFSIDAWPIGKPENLTELERETADIVIGHYGELNAQQLSDLTHSEAPWKEARGSLPVTERGNSEITLESLSEYYSSLPPQ